MCGDLLRFTTAGCVDDGKSTLIGRLLHDTKALFDDQLDALALSTARGGEGLDLALVTDGLRAEREQGITIDVAHRYFSTPQRSFIIADAPGHDRYTRNMVTAASTADVAVILADAPPGLVEQTRRHAAVTGLLGVGHVVLAVNKMDLVDWSEDVFDAIAEEFAVLADAVGIDSVVPIPISALRGDNVVDRSTEMGGPPARSSSTSSRWSWRRRSGIHGRPAPGAVGDPPRGRAALTPGRWWRAC